MLNSYFQLLKSPYNREHKVSAFVRFIHWKVIRLLKISSYKFKIWNDRSFFIDYDSFHSMWLVYNYIVDWEEFNLIQDYLNPSDDVADVGTNIGYYTIWMSSFINQEGKIHSFEPDEKNFKKLKNNIELNNLLTVKANNIALSKIDGPIEFTVGLDGENSIATDNSKKSNIIQSRKFDTYFLENSIEKMSYVKVDIEGFELHFLNGAQDILENKKVEIFQLEINTQIKNSGGSIEELVEFIKQYDYSLCYYDVDNKMLVSCNYTANRENYFMVGDVAFSNSKIQSNVIG